MCACVYVKDQHAGNFLFFGDWSGARKGGDSISGSHAEGSVGMARKGAVSASWART